MSYKIKTTIFNAKSEFFPNITQSNKCFLGVSIDSPFIKSKHIERVLHWIDTNYSECLILIGDDLHRHNESIFIHEKPQDMGFNSYTEIIENNLSKGIETLKSKKFTIVRWNNFNSTPEFYFTKQLYENFLLNNNDFSEYITKYAKEFLSRQIERGNFPIISEDNAIQSSVNYIIEEMAVFTILMDNGYQTLIYPGTILQIFKDIVNNIFPYITTSLSHGTYIDLNIKKY